MLQQSSRPACVPKPIFSSLLLVVHPLALPSTKVWLETASKSCLCFSFCSSSCLRKISTYRRSETDFLTPSLPRNQNSWVAPKLGRVSHGHFPLIESAWREVFEHFQLRSPHTHRMAQTKASDTLEDMLTVRERLMGWLDCFLFAFRFVLSKRCRLCFSSAGAGA